VALTATLGVSRHEDTHDRDVHLAIRSRSGRRSSAARVFISSPRAAEPGTCCDGAHPPRWQNQPGLMAVRGCDSPSCTARVSLQPCRTMLGLGAR
jgi:hypothetical protein